MVPFTLYHSIFPKVPPEPLKTETETETQKGTQTEIFYFFTLVKVASKNIKNWSSYLG